MKLHRILAFLSLLVVLPCRSEAWNGAGHMLIASFAYRQLSEDRKSALVELLKHHPAYSKWNSAFKRTANKPNLGEFLFMRASLWPDEIRRTGNPADHPFDHPEWHFIDYPLQPPGFQDGDSPDPDNDILYGIAQSVDAVESPELPIEARAAYLSWLLHLIGDIHQPLHCATLITDAFPAPIGDRGGNSVFVRPNTAPIKLHTFWDELLGKSRQWNTAINRGIELQNRLPANSLGELDADRTPRAWSLASRRLAKEKAYLDGKLLGSPIAAEAPDLPADYGVNAKAVAERQVALAGYRLATLLMELNFPVDQNE